MKNFLFAALILMIMISCGRFQKSEKPVTENERSEYIFGEFKILYQRLLTFKNTPDFKTNGFEGSGLIAEWLIQVKQLQENPDSILLQRKSIDVGDLIQLGLAYADSKGEETETTLSINKNFEEAIIPQHIEQETIDADSVSPDKTISIVELFSQFPTEYLLYPNGIKDNPVTHPYHETYVDSIVHPKSLTGLNRVFSFVSEPTYMIFPANREKNRGIGLIIFPGGGLKNVWLDKEGTDIAIWLSEQGITSMVVKYRTNRVDADGDFLVDFGDYKGAIYQDARTSMHIMKELADSLNFDKNTIGMMGFSAGGWLTERMVFKYYDGDYDWNPDFVALIYHGNNIKFIQEVKDKEKLPPFFMAIARNDNRLTFEKVLPYLNMVSAEVKDSELHIYLDGGHGFGLAYEGDVSEWKNDFVKWLDRLYK